MDLSDIPIIRKQFQELNEEWHNEISTVPQVPINTPNILYATHLRRDKLLEIGEKYDKKVRELCKSLFGSDLAVYATDYMDPLEVLDWIEHFMKKD
jgi:hypothetical protein